jgi:ABC-2 type transport system permease protein
MAISELVSSVPALLVLTILAGIYLHLKTAGVLELVAILLMMFTTSIMIGYTFSTFSSDIVQAGGFSRLVSTLLSTIPPVYYPITYIPFPYRYLAYFSPTTYAAELAQNVAGYLTLSLQERAFSWIILIGITVALVLITRSKARWREI